MVWDFDDVTSYKAEVELVRGITPNSSKRADQLYIWVRKEDYEYLGKRMQKWYKAEEEQYNGYSIYKVHISLHKRFPMFIMYYCVDEFNDQLTSNEVGNFANIEQERVQAYNTANGTNLRVEYGDNTASNMNESFKLGRKYQKYVKMLQALNYKMISTKESGLITDDV